MADLPTRAARAIRSGARPGGWMRDGVWTVLDQGLFAGANFLVNVLLARWLTPDAYGAFSVAFVVFLLMGTVHGGLLIEPMLVFGSGRFEGRLPSYLRELLRGHALYSLVGGLVLAAVGGAAWAWGSPTLGANFLALSLAAGAILALWLMRRACYVVGQPQWAATAGALYLVLLVASAAAASAGGWLSGPVALGLMGGTSVVAAVALAARLGVFRGERAPDLAAEARAAHVDYGRWAGMTGVLEWAHGALPFLVLPAFVGLAGSGTLRALYNLAMPALQAFSALTVLALPVFVRARAEGTIRRTGGRVGAGLFGLSVLYALAILVAGRPLVDWLYNGQYAVGGWSLALLAALPVASALSGLLMALLRSDERPEPVFKARAWAVAAAGTVGTALIAALGVVGALASDLVALVVESGVLGRSLRRGPTGEAPPEPEPDRLRVLLSSFACAPGVGSEPAVGWNTAREMARHHDVTVLVYEGFRPGTDAELAERPVEGLEVVYYALPFEAERFRTGETYRTGLAEQLHYVLWQRGARGVARRLHRAQPFDVVHHVTFVKYWAPTALDGLDAPFVWGPVGGGESAPPSFYPHLSPDGLAYERRRDLARRVMAWDPAVRRAARRADLTFATTDETRQRVEALGAAPAEVRSAIALPRAEVEALAAVPPPDDGPLRLVSIGRQVPFKGFRFGLMAYARALAAGDPALAESELWLIGDGPEHDTLRALVTDLGLGEHVHVLGAVSRDEVLDRLGQAHALLHPSLHESGGGVCLEALAAGRPVLGFALGGIPVHVPADAGILVPADDYEAAIDGLAEAIRLVAADPAARRAMGEAGRASVAASFCWDDRVARLADRYWDLAARPRPVAAVADLALA